MGAPADAWSGPAPFEIQPPPTPPPQQPDDAADPNAVLNWEGPAPFQMQPPATSQDVEPQTVPVAPGGNIRRLQPGAKNAPNYFSVSETPGSQASRPIV